MTITYFPFDSGAGATVIESQWAEMARLWLSTGVFNSGRAHIDLNKFEVFGDNSGLQVKVKSGTAWIEGFYVTSGAEEIVTLSTADATNPRIDRIILKLDRGANTITLTKLTGTPAGSPSAPALTQNSTIWEISLAQVMVAATDTLIAAGDVTDERNYCTNLLADLSNILGGMPTPRGYINGFILSNNGTDANNDIDIAAGLCKDGTDAVSITLAASITKRLDANWVVGTNQGGLDTGAKANSTWYHLFVIKNPITLVVDVLFSTSFASPTMPSGYTYKRRIGAVRTDGSGNLLAFLQYEDDFVWKSPTLDVGVSNLSTTRTNYTVKVPTGTPLLVRGNVFFDNASQTALYISNPNLTDLAPISTAAPLQTSGLDTGANDQSFVYEGWTDASAQIAARAGAATTTFRFATLGWKDPRGK